MKGLQLRLGVVGCGAVATAVHLRSARRIPGVSVTALADPSAAARDRAAQMAPGAACLESADELLARDDIDGVIVASPSLTHGTLGVRVLEAGKHLYLEKPVATSLDDAERLATAAAGARVVAAVGFNRRFHPLVLEARDRLERGELGALAGVRTRFDEPLSGGALPEWKRRRESGGGAPLDLGSHHVDLVRFLLGIELVAETADLRSVRSDLDDCTLDFASDRVPVRIECSFHGRRSDVLTIEDVDGRTLTVDRYAGLLTIAGSRVRGRGLVAVRARARLRPLVDISYRPALRAFVDRIAGAEVALPTIADGVASLRAILAAEAAGVVLAC